MIAHCYFRQLLLIKGFDSSKAYLIILQDCRLDEWKANKSPKSRMSLSHLLNCYVTLTFDSGEKSSKCGECLYQEITQSEASQIGELNIDYYFMGRLYRFLIAESWRWFRSRCYPAMMVIKLHYSIVCFYDVSFWSVITPSIMISIACRKLIIWMNDKGSNRSESNSFVILNFDTTKLISQGWNRSKLNN